MSMRPCLVLRGLAFDRIAEQAGAAGFDPHLAVFSSSARPRAGIGGLRRGGSALLAAGPGGTRRAATTARDFGGFWRGWGRGGRVRGRRTRSAPATDGAGGLLRSRRRGGGSFDLGPRRRCGRGEGAALDVAPVLEHAGIEIESRTENAAFRARDGAGVSRRYRTRRNAGMARRGQEQRGGGDSAFMGTAWAGCDSRLAYAGAARTNVDVPHAGEWPRFGL